jgi:SAM-dependent methyltransferase
LILRTSLSIYRKFEVEKALAELDSAYTNGDMLELGCGDCYQSVIIGSKFNVLTTDIKIHSKIHPPILVCDACNLPFKENSFDIIYSSCLLEHIPNQKKTFKEMKRILRSRGVVIAILPTVIWKVLSILFAFLQLRRGIISGKNLAFKEGLSIHTYSHIKKLLKLPRKLVHGTYKNNILELLAYRKISWIKLFENNGFYVKKSKPLGLTYAPGIFILQNNLRLSSSILILAKSKKDPF